MAVYSYKAFDVQASDIAGATMNGTVTADTPRQARDLLRRRGLTVEHLAQLNARKPRRFSGRRRDQSKVTAFSRELSTLLGVGIPLTDALDTIAAQYQGSFRSTVQLLREEVAAGASLATAMALQPAVFDELFVNLVEVGEDSGTLETSLDRLVQFRQRREQIRGKVSTALLYPCMVLLTAVGVSIFLMTYVVPNILQPLVEAGRPLPLPTRLVKAISDFLVQCGWLAALGAMVFLGLFFATLRTKRGRWFWDSLILRLPLVGSMVRQAAVVRIAIVVETLLSSGVVFIRAIHVAAKSTPNVVLRTALLNCETAVSAGRDIAPALESAKAFPSLVIQVFSVGQQSGRLEEMLNRLARDYDEQVAATTQRLTAFLEPVLILMLAMIVATIAMATMLPILEAGNVLG